MGSDTNTRAAAIAALGGVEKARETIEQAHPQVPLDRESWPPRYRTEAAICDLALSALDGDGDARLRELRKTLVDRWSACIEAKKGHEVGSLKRAAIAAAADAYQQASWDVDGMLAQPEPEAPETANPPGSPDGWEARIAALRRLHERMIANAGGDFEIDCDEEFRLAMKQDAPALLDELERLRTNERMMMARIADYDECPEDPVAAVMHVADCFDHMTAIVAGATKTRTLRVTQTGEHFCQTQCEERKSLAARAEKAEAEARIDRKDSDAYLASRDMFRRQVDDAREAVEAGPDESLVDAVKGLRAKLAKAEKQRDESHAFVQGIATAATGRDCPPVTGTNIHRVADEALGALAKLRAERDAALAAQNAPAAPEAKEGDRILRGYRDEFRRYRDGVELAWLQATVDELCRRALGGAS